VKAFLQAVSETALRMFGRTQRYYHQQLKQYLDLKSFDTYTDEILRNHLSALAGSQLPSLVAWYFVSIWRQKNYY
jgi:hypothetical protein